MSNFPTPPVRHHWDASEDLDQIDVEFQIQQGIFSPGGPSFIFGFSNAYTVKSQFLDAEPGADYPTPSLPTLNHDEEPPIPHALRRAARRGRFYG